MVSGLCRKVSGLLRGDDNAGCPYVLVTASSCVTLFGEGRVELLAAGSLPCGSQIRRTRETGALGTRAQPTQAWAQPAEILCSAEKPAAPKKSRSRRSRISVLRPLSCLSVYS